MLNSPRIHGYAAKDMIFLEKDLYFDIMHVITPHIIILVLTSFSYGLMVEEDEVMTFVRTLHHQYLTA